MRSTSPTRALGTLFAYALLLAVIVVFLFPIVWMFSYAVRPVTLPAPARFELFVLPLAFENFARLNEFMPVGQLTLNSLRVVALAVPLTLVTASWAGFAIAQLPPRARGLFLLLSIALMLVPALATWIPRFVLFTQLRWIDTILPLLAPALMGTNPFFVILFYLAFRRVPREVYESAHLDGANALRIWWSIALPLAVPALLAVGVLSAAYYWSNYSDPLLYLRREVNYTLPIGVQLMEKAQANNFPLMMAVAVVMVAPVLAMFLLVQPFFLQGKIAERWLK
jgi:multiple sugar transport system permease protein